MVDMVGFLGGGQMAQALISGATSSGFLEPDNICVVEPLTATRELLQEKFPGLTLMTAASGMLSQCQRIVLAVKPQVLQAIAKPELAKHVRPEHCWLSIAAGISLESLCESLGTRQVVRVMPNTPCQVGAGASGLSATNEVNCDFVDWAQKLMESVGICLKVPDSLLHAVTGVSGSSPAYIYMIIEALADGGVASGLARETALRLAAQAVFGAAKMVLETGLHPGQLKDQVTSPGGTTIAALRELERGGVRSAFIEAVCQAAQRSQQLS
ncbi:MAG: pyrroline-5-carboxylate reductase [Planctomycetales bacterium]|nr:pyrroline-5-carboxylate reductase [Planctomycetales bacterium]